MNTTVHARGRMIELPTNKAAELVKALCEVGIREITLVSYGLGLAPENKFLPDYPKYLCQNLIRGTFFAKQIHQLGRIK